MGLIRDYGGLIAMRLLLGAFEAGLFPGDSYDFRKLTFTDLNQDVFILYQCTTNVMSFNGA